MISSAQMFLCLTFVPSCHPCFYVRVSPVLLWQSVSGAGFCFAFSMSHLVRLVTAVFPSCSLFPHVCILRCYQSDRLFIVPCVSPPAFPSFRLFFVFVSSLFASGFFLDFFPSTITACFLLNIHLHSMCLHLGPPSNPATVCQLRQWQVLLAL